MKGQSLIELLVALGIFAAMTAIVSSLLIAGFVPGLQSQENSMALSLAQEGLEAARSIRDNDWDDLSEGSNGLALSDNHWIFQGSKEDISLKLPEGERKIIVESAGSDRKKVVSEITWKSFLNQNKKIELKTYLTNWQK